MLGQAVSEVDLKSGRVLRTIDLPAEPYTCAVSPDGTTLFVSLWGGAKVLLFDAAHARREGRDRRRRAPQRDGDHQGRQAALRRVRQHERGVGRRRGQPPGDRADPHLALSRCAARIDAEPREPLARRARAARRQRRQQHRRASSTCRSPARAASTGSSRPAGIRRRAMFSRDAKKIFILSGKGLTSVPNPRFKRRELVGGDVQYIGAMLTGTLSILPVPTPATLQALTKTVYSVTPYADRYRLTPAGAPAASPIPQARRRSVADQARLLLHPREPQLRSGARRSRQGQRRSDAHALRRGRDAERARAGARVRRLRQLLRRRRGQLRRPRVLHRRLRHRHRREVLADQLRRPRRRVPERGRRRDAQCLRQRRGAGERLHLGRVRARGEERAELRRVRLSEQGARERRAGARGLQGNIDVDYPPFNLDIQDQKRVDAWLEEFRSSSRRAQVPALSIIRLGNDHTAATRPGSPTPRAMVADNDLALGRIVEAIIEERDLEGVGDLRPRGRRPERPGSRGRAPLGAARGQPVLAAARARQHALHDVRRAAHDGADPRACRR